MQNNYPNIKWLFTILPKIGFGNKRKFKGSVDDFEYAYKVVEGCGSVNLIFHRWDYNEKGGELNINDWYNHIAKTEDNYMTYMLNNYSLINGLFQVEKDSNKIEELAGVFKSYYNKK